MKIHNVTQGSDAWKALRATAFTASEAPAMMGASRYQSRTDLLHAKHTGFVPAVDDAKQALFDQGHDTEAMFRPIAEDMLDGEDLSPVTGTIELEGMTLLASFDGLTFDRSTGYEHKLFNTNIASAIEKDGEPGPAYYWQMEHQLLVSGAKRILFVTSDGTRERMAHCFYESKPERRAQLVAGWKQFAADLATYVPESAPAKMVAQAVTDLPSVAVHVEGQLAVRDNLKTFGEALRDFLDNKLIKKPESDQDFADLDLQIKALKKAEDALDAAEAAMLAQVAAVDDVKRAKDMLHKMARDHRLAAEKVLKNRKEEIKAEVVADGLSKYRAHIAALNTRLGKPYMPTLPVDFGAAIKGLKNLDSLRNAIDTELARSKIAANEVADRIDLNLKHLRENAAEHTFLLSDTAALVLKAPEDLQAVVANRIGEHKRQEEQRLEAERERIRREEAARLEREARDRQAAADAEAARQAQAAIAAAATPAPEVRKYDNGAPMFSTTTFKENGDPIMLTPDGKRSVFCDVDEAGPDTVKPDNGARLRLGELNARIAPLSITADDLAELGFKPVAVEKAAKLYRESDLPAILHAIAEHVESLYEAACAN